MSFNFLSLLFWNFTTFLENLEHYETDDEIFMMIGLQRHVGNGWDNKY